jgi:hypothetical protein
MMRLHYLISCYLCLLLLAPGLVAASSATPPQPAWKVLEFEEKAFWATAKSRVEVTLPGDKNQHLQFSASSSVVGNSEQVVLNVDPANGQAHTRSRLSRGKDQRLKTFDYQADHIVRERRNPVADPNTPPEQWPVASRKEIAYPPGASDNVVTDAYVLLLLADRLQAGPEESAKVIVHTDLNFYEVNMTRGNGIPVEVDYQVTGGEKVSGKRDTRAVALQISPLGELAEKPDFSLLGLHGEIILFFDRDSGLPLQVRGTAPRIGPMEINLKAVTLREPPA